MLIEVGPQILNTILSCCGVLSLGIVHFQFHPLHPAADITDAPFHRLVVTIHRIRVETIVYLMVISVGMLQFPMLIIDIENCEFNRT